MPDDRDWPEIILLAITATAASLMALAVIQPDIELMREITEAAADAAPYETPAEAVFAVISFIGVAIAALRRRFS